MFRRLRARPLWLALLIALVVVPTAIAATVVDDEDYVLPADEVIDGNLYAFGNTVTIKGTVNGDLIAAGTEVIIEPGGFVTEDVLAAGQSIIIEGTVGDDVRAAGFTVQLEEDATVDGEFVAAGFNVSIAKGAQVGGDVLAAGYQGVVDGAVGGDLDFAGVALSIAGTVAGDADVAVDEPSDQNMDWLSNIPGMPDLPSEVNPGLTIDEDTAEIGGTLTYESPVEFDVPGSAVVGSVEYQAPEVDEDADEEDGDKDKDKDKDKDADEEDNAFVDWLINAVVYFVSLLIVGLLVIWLWPRLVNSAAAALSERPLPSFGWGLATVAVAILLLLAVPVITVILAAFFGLIQLSPLVKLVMAKGALVWAVVFFGLYLVSWLARIVASQWMGRGLLGRFAPGVADNRVVPLILGLLIYVLLVTLPYIGILFKLIFVLLGLGALDIRSWFSWLFRRDTEVYEPVEP